MTIIQSIELTQVNCGACGGTYAINSRFHQQKEERGGGWNCPYCKCNWGYFGDTALKRAEKAAARAQELLDQERMRHQQTRDSRDHQERRARSLKGVVTMTKKRIAGGKCPCCSKSFHDLKTHMDEKHPTYLPATE